MHRLAAQSLSLHPQCLGSAAQCRVVGHSEIEAEQTDDGPKQSLSLAQSQAIDGAQRQRRGDRQGGVVRLPTARGPWLSTPARDRRGCEPDGVDGPQRHQCATMRGCQNLQQMEPSTMSISMIGLDTAKSVFQIHGVNEAEIAELKRKLRRSELVAFFEK